MVSAGGDAAPLQTQAAAPPRGNTGDQFMPLQPRELWCVGLELLVGVVGRQTKNSKMELPLFTGEKNEEFGPKGYCKCSAWSGMYDKQAQPMCRAARELNASWQRWKGRARAKCFLGLATFGE